MYEIHFFRDADDPFRMAVTPEKSGSVLPGDNWKPWFSQEAHPEHAGPVLNQWEESFRRDGYHILK
jgi:hypothetical protein